MNKKINKKILFFILFLLAGILPVIASAQGLPPIIIKIKNMFISIGGSIVIIGWIIAGILYLTAAGSPEKIGTAKKALFACIVGTAIIILATSAQTILEFYLK